MPLKPKVYMDLLRELVDTHGTHIWLVNTGWLGPQTAHRARVDITVSKAIINAVRDQSIDLSPENFWYEPTFKMHIPKSYQAWIRLKSSKCLGRRRVFQSKQIVCRSFFRVLLNH